MKEIKEKIKTASVDVKVEAEKVEAEIKDEVEKVVEFIEEGLNIEPKAEGEAAEVVTAPIMATAEIPAVDNDHVAPGATLFIPEEIALNAAPTVSAGEPAVNWAHLD